MNINTFKKFLEVQWLALGFKVGVEFKGRIFKVIFMDSQEVPVELKKELRQIVPKGYAIRYYRAKGLSRFVLKVKAIIHELTFRQWLSNFD